MKVLLVHQNFPGQMRHLGLALHRRGDRVISIGGPLSAKQAPWQLIRYNELLNKPHPCHRWAEDNLSKVLRAETVGAIMFKLRQEGWTPDIVIGHSGWGELVPVKDIFPDVPVMHYLELFYQPKGLDVNFDPEFEDQNWDNQTKVRIRQSLQLQALHSLDMVLMPTRFQADTIPIEYRHKCEIIHEGIDTEAISPIDDRYIKLKKAGLTLRKGDEVVSFVNRSLEPMRGFHVFMRSLPKLQQLRPNAQIIIVGSENVSYGQPPQGHANWKDAMLHELSGKIDLSRIHFVGKVPHDTLHDIFRICSCHVYLTYPFVLSWSMLEAMSCEAVVIGSKTPPVGEVIEHQKNGLLVDFFDTNELAETIAQVLSDPDQYRILAQQARKTIQERYDLNTVCLPKLLNLVDTMAKTGNSIIPAATDNALLT
jgi:glycosyltransferase involved in cell wall biosynthesis